jgi:hypothetical protein
VILPTTDGRHLVMPRHTEPEPDLAAASASETHIATAASTTPHPTSGRGLRRIENIVQTCTMPLLKTKELAASDASKCESWASALPMASNELRTDHVPVRTEAYPHRFSS